MPERAPNKREATNILPMLRRTTIVQIAFNANESVISFPVNMSHVKVKILTRWMQTMPKWESGPMVLQLRPFLFISGAEKIGRKMVPICRTPHENLFSHRRSPIRDIQSSIAR
jgi:hypothetical protein